MKEVEYILRAQIVHERICPIISPTDTRGYQSFLEINYRKARNSLIENVRKAASSSKTHLRSFLDQI